MRENLLLVNSFTGRIVNTQENNKEYLDAIAKTTGITRKAIDSIMKDNKRDAIIAPTNGFAFTTAGV